METVLFNLRHNTKANPAFMSLLKSDAHKGARKLMEGVYLSNDLPKLLVIMLI